MAFEIGVQLSGARELGFILRKLPDRMHKVVLKGGVKKALKPVVKTARSNLSGHERTGQLRKSLGSVVRVYSSGVVAGFVGPRKGFFAIINGQRVDPENYAHLIELGHRVVTGGSVARKGKLLKKRGDTGTVAGFVEPVPFLRDAHHRHRSTMVRALITETRTGINREVKKLARKAPRSRRRVA